MPRFRAARETITGACTLADYPEAMVRVACRKCDRGGQYRRSSLIALYGEEVALPDVLGQIAHDCPKRGACGVETAHASGRRAGCAQDCAAKRVRRRTRQWI